MKQIVLARLRLAAPVPLVIARVLEIFGLLVTLGVLVTSGLRVPPALAFAQSTARPETPEVKVTVDGAHPWVDSGMVVKKGDRLTFKAEGTIKWGDKPDQVADPDGKDPKPGRVGVGGLIGRVGYNGKPFSIGTTQTPLVMPKEGKLFLGINDFVFRDNGGSFTVTISIPKETQSPPNRG